MKIKKINSNKKERDSIGFDAKSLEIDKDRVGFTTSTEDAEKEEKEFKRKNKIEKFESFVTINIDNVENFEIEGEIEEDDDEFDAEYEEDEGCGCCEDCTGEPGCHCGCDDCYCDSEEDTELYKVSDFIGNLFSENLKWHLKNSKPITENIFRPGSKAFYDLIKEARNLYELGRVNLCELDKKIFESTDIGKFAKFKGKLVPLDLPMENVEEINEAKYKGKEVELNHPMRSSGPKKYKVYVRNPKSGNIKCVNFGDVKGGLTSKVNDPKARKAFAQRHKCSMKKDKTKAGYWACRLPRYKHLVKTDFSGYW